MRILLTIAVLLVLAVPAASAAPPTGDEPKNAAKACKAERGTTALSIEAFAQRYGKNKNKKNAFGKCVSSKAKEKAKEEEDAEEDEEKQEAEAAKVCKAERGTSAASIAAFNKEHGTNKNKKNAFGKCVSKHSKSG
ncbi:MAG: hypothetical protein WD380_04825 [Gaiellaceae bacterium]